MRMCSFSYRIIIECVGGVLGMEKQSVYAELEKKVKPFLDASSHLYKRVCPSVGPSVRPSVSRYVCHAFVKNA